MSFLVRTDIDDATSDVFVQMMKSADVAGLTTIHPNIQARITSQANMTESRFVFIESKPLLMVPILTPGEEREYAADEKVFIRKYLTNPEWLLQRKYLVLDGAMRRFLCIRYALCLCLFIVPVTFFAHIRDSSDLYFRMLLPNTPPSVMLQFISEANNQDAGRCSG